MNSITVNSQIKSTINQRPEKENGKRNFENWVLIGLYGLKALRHIVLYQQMRLFRLPGYHNP